MPDSTPLPDSSISPLPADALRRAVAIIGGQSKTARLLDLSQTSIWKWVSKGKVLPAEYCLKVEAATGISRHELRPDIYPVEAPALPVHAVSDPAAVSISEGGNPSHADVDIDPVEASAPTTNGAVAGGKVAQSFGDPDCATNPLPPTIGKAAA